MAMVRRHLPFHLVVAVVSLILLPLLPHAGDVAVELNLHHDAALTNSTISHPPHATAAALPMGSRDAPSSPTTRVQEFSDNGRAPASPTSTLSNGGSSSARRLLATTVVERPQEEQAATAPSPHAAPPATRRPHHTRGAMRTRYAYNGVTFADLHDACVRHYCGADPFHRLATVLYGPHPYGSGRWVGGDDIYCVVRTIEGSLPILPRSWRAAVAGGGDLCYVEVGHMDDDSFGIDCPAWTCVRHCTTSPAEALVLAVNAISTPCGGVTSSSTASSPLNTALLYTLAPLLAAAFLPRPVAVVLVLSTLARLVHADLAEDVYLKLNHATCAIYPYDNSTGTIEHARPVPGLREVCLRPLCIDADADERTLSVAYAERHGRPDDPLRVYCALHSLEGASSPSIFFPWRNTWRAHLPVADAAAAAASGDNVCYVELAHLDYREGYYIRCPVGDGHARVSCTEFPDEAVAAPVWERRRLTYRDVVGSQCERYKYGAAGPLFGEYDYDAEL